MCVHQANNKIANNKLT